MNQRHDETDTDTQSRPTGTGWLSVLGSVLAAGFGVQSDTARARDFQRGKWQHFVIGGLVGTALFIFLIYSVVQWVLP